jgi:DNA primase
MEYDEVVYWQSRELLDKMFMFPDLETTGLAKTDYLYNFDEVLQPCECLVVVESIFNCLSIGEDCVATGGAKIPDRAKQIIKLKLLDPKVIVLAPDNDEAGLTSLRDNYYILKDHFRLAYCLPPKGLDWNDLDVKNGHGTARRYIEGYTKQLDLFALCDRLEVV